MSKNTLVIVTGGIGESPLTAALSPEYVALRDKALEKTTSIVSVDSNEDAERGSLIAGLAKGLSNQIKKEKEEAKRPFLDINNALEEVMRQGTLPLNKEVARIEGLIGAFKLKQQQEYEAAQRRAREEAARQQREADEIARKAREVQAAIDNAKNADAKAAAEAQAATLRRQQLQHEIEQAENEAEHEAAIVAPVKVQGSSIKPTYNVEVIDVKALYESYPEAVTLTVKMSVLNDAVRAGRLVIPGCKITEKVSAVARSISPSLTLND